MRASTDPEHYLSPQLSIEKLRRIASFRHLAAKLSGLFVPLIRFDRSCGTPCRRNNMPQGSILHPRSPGQQPYGTPDGFGVVLRDTVALVKRVAQRVLCDRVSLFSRFAVPLYRFRKLVTMPSPPCEYASASSSCAPACCFPPLFGTSSALAHR